MTTPPPELALANARLRDQQLTAYPGPAPQDSDAAFDLQQQITRTLGWTPFGWKIGATNEAATKMLGTAEPFAGPIFAERRFTSGDAIPCAGWAMRLIEPEIAVSLGTDLPARGEAYTLEEIIPAIDAIHASIETVNRRVPGGLGDNLMWSIADGGCNDAIMLGEPCRPPLDTADFATIEVNASVNGKSIATGTSVRALGGPHHVLLWLANFLSPRGLGLKAGEIVTTGVVTDIFTIKAGDTVEADFGPLGTLTAQY